MAWTTDGKWIPDQAAPEPQYTPAWDNDQGTVPGPAPAPQGGDDGSWMGGIKKMFPGLGPQKPRGVDPSVGQGLLADLGLSPDSPEYKAYTGYMKAAQAYAPKQMYYGGYDNKGDALMQVLADSGSAGALAWGGHKDPMMFSSIHARAGADARVAGANKANEMQYDVIKNGAMPTILKRIEDDRILGRRNAAVKESMGNIYGSDAAPVGRQSTMPPAIASAAGKALAGDPAATPPIIPTPNAPAGMQVTPTTAGAPPIPGQVPGGRGGIDTSLGAPRVANAGGTGMQGEGVRALRASMTPEARAVFDTTYQAGLRDFQETGKGGPEVALSAAVEKAMSHDIGIKGRELASQEKVKADQTDDHELLKDARDTGRAARDMLQSINQMREIGHLRDANGNFQYERDSKGNIVRDQYTGQPKPKLHERLDNVIGAWNGSDFTKNWVEPVLGMRNDQELRGRLQLPMEKIKLAASGLIKGQGQITEAERKMLADSQSTGFTAANAQSLMESLRQTQELAHRQLIRSQIAETQGARGVREFDARMSQHFNEQAMGSDPEGAGSRAAKAMSEKTAQVEGVAKTVAPEAVAAVKSAKVNDERTAPDGTIYVKTPDGWVPKTSAKGAGPSVWDQVFGKGGEEKVKQRAKSGYQGNNSANKMLQDPGR